SVLFFLLCLVVRLSPTSTLFPYTTLFRSFTPEGPEGKGYFAMAPKVTPHDKCRRNTNAAPFHRHAMKGGLVQGKCRPKANFALRDRKSTRLNSSHVKISYAVFCLKKKKTD